MTGPDFPDWQSAIAELTPILNVGNVPIGTTESWTPWFDLSAFASFTLSAYCALQTMRVDIYQQSLNPVGGYQSIKAWHIPAGVRLTWQFPVVAGQLQVGYIAPAAGTLTALSITGLRTEAPAPVLQSGALLAGGWGVPIPASGTVSVNLPPYAGTATVTWSRALAKSCNVYIASFDYGGAHMGMVQVDSGLTAGHSTRIALPPLINTLTLQDTSATADTWYYGVVAG